MTIFVEEVGTNAQLGWIQVNERKQLKAMGIDNSFVKLFCKGEQESKARLLCCCCFVFCFA